MKIYFRRSTGPLQSRLLSLDDNTCEGRNKQRPKSGQNNHLKIGENCDYPMTGSRLIRKRKTQALDMIVRPSGISKAPRNHAIPEGNCSAVVVTAQAGTGMASRIITAKRTMLSQIQINMSDMKSRMASQDSKKNIMRSLRV